MTVRELAPGSAVTIHGKPYVIERHSDNGAMSWLHSPSDPHDIACVRSGWTVEAGAIQVRYQGPGSAGAEGDSE